MSKDVLGVDSASFAAFMRGPIADLVSKSFGVEGPRFRFELKKFLKRQACWENGSAFPIDRSKKFNPNELFGTNWRVLHENPRSLSVSYLDLDLVSLLTPPSTIKQKQAADVYEQLVASNSIFLDVQTFETLWENQFLIPETWKGRPYDERRPYDEPLICFPGTVLQESNGFRYVVALYWDRGKKRWSYILVHLTELTREGAVFAAI